MDRRSLIAGGVQLVTIFTPIAAGLFAILRYLDVRNRELSTERLKTYNNLIRTMSGTRPDGSEAFLAEQIHAIYQLREFPEYSQTSIDMLEASMTAPEWKEELGVYASKVIKDLQQ